MTNAAPGVAPGSAGRPSVVVACAFVMLMLNTGFGFYSLGIFSGAYVDERGISLTTTSAASTLYLLAGGVGGLLMARLLARISASVLVACTALVVGVCLALAGLVVSDTQVILLFAAFGIASSGYGMVTASHLVLEAHPANGSAARPLAIAAAGFSVGGALLTVVVSTMVNEFGLVVSGLVLGGLVVLLLVPLSFLAAGQMPRGDGGRPHGSSLIERDSADEIDVPRRQFLAITVAIALLFLSQVGAVTHMVTFGRERGIAGATIAITVIAAFSVIGRGIGIVLVSRVSLRSISLGLAALQICALLLLASSYSLATVLIAAVLLGLTVGNNQIMVSLWMLAMYGARRYRKQFASANMITSVGTATAPLLIGAVHQLSGGYTIPFVLAAFGSLLAGVLVLTMPSGRPVAAVERERPPARL